MARATRDSAVTDRLDAAFDCLQPAHCRYLLYSLSDSEEAVVPVEAAVEAVRRYAAAGTETDELPPRQPIRLSVVHGHLPRLQSLDVLDYDPRRGTVRFHGSDPLDEWLERARRLELG